MSTKDNLSYLQLGIWSVALNKQSLIPELFHKGKKKEGSKDGEDKPKKLELEASSISCLWRFTKEVYSLGPLYFIIHILMNFWLVVSGVLELYYMTNLLSSISRCLETRKLERYSIIEALVCNVVLAVLGESLNKIGSTYSAVLQERIKHHFMQKTMHSVLNFDILTAEDPEVRTKIDKNAEDLTKQDAEVCQAFRNLTKTTTDFVTILSRLSLMFRLFRSSSTFTLSILLSVVHPLYYTLRSNLYGRSFVAFCNNNHFTRMTSLHSLTFNDKHREDRITNNLGHYIEREFEKSRRLLGDVSTENVYIQWFKRRPVLVEIFDSLYWSWSTLFFALRMLWDFKSVSLDELILVQQTSSAVQSSLYGLLYKCKTIPGLLQAVRNSYALEDVTNKIKDGDLPYPFHSEGMSDSGAEIEFRNVSFNYPGTDKTALDKVSFAIKAGQLVVIVGVNGSGKSTATKLLSRLYDPSAGEIVLDGRPLTSYRLADIRRSMAVLRQDHPVLPLSLRENVALGVPERDSVADSEIEEAIRQGGAEKVAENLKDGSETVLDPVNTVLSHVTGGRDGPLRDIVKDKEVKVDLSGGETQRLSASRTFMRLMAGNVRLLIADEPTSALDPEGEYELLRRLRDQSGGKTVIFITHRFGHLTKYADLILCLKDGHLAEQGTHEELISCDGEYGRLYHLQARAFE